MSDFDYFTIRISIILPMYNMQKALQGVRGNGNSGIHATIRKT